MIPVMNETNRSVRINGMTRYLTPKEFGILKFLSAHPNEIYTSDDIYRNVGKDVPFATEGVIAVHLRHLREKIEEDPSEPRFLRSYWGKGYSFVK